MRDVYQPMGENEGQSMTAINKNAPDYVAAVVAQLPQRNDPKDRRIIQVIRDQLIATPWAKDAFSHVTESQIDYLKDMLGHLDDKDYIFQKTQEELKYVADTLHAHVAEGQEILDALPKKTPTILATNHLGTFKEGEIDPREVLGVDIPGFDLMFPYPLYPAPLYPVAQALGDNLSYTGFEFPLQFGQIYEAANFVPIRPPIQGIATSRTEELQTLIQQAFERHPNTAIIHFPEGGTSGKRNEKGPYDLGEYKKGIFAVAANLGLPVVPVAQYFHPEKGFELKVFKPLTFKQGMSREESEVVVGGAAEQTRARMQEWFDHEQAA